MVFTFKCFYFYFFIHCYIFCLLFILYLYTYISIHLYSIVLLYYMFLISYIIPGQKQYYFCVPAERLISSILFFKYGLLCIHCRELKKTIYFFIFFKKKERKRKSRRLITQILNETTIRQLIFQLRIDFLEGFFIHIFSTQYLLNRTVLLL